MTAPETIFAVSTAAGRAGIAVVRISGPRSGEALSGLTGGRLPAARRAVRSRFRNPATGETIDDGLALWFPAPASVTGEDVAECHIHGGPAVVAALIAALGPFEGLRPAEPGEFTRRAFDNGKLDLTAVEGLADLIEAETEAQRRQALRQYDGVLATLYEGWRARLIALLAHAEAAIDFPDEELPDGLLADVLSQAIDIIKEIDEHLSDDRRGERLRDGLQVAIVGAPNVGKSSLLNRIAQRDVVIVSDIAGTTRDVVEVHLDLGGYPVTLADTAGVRDAKDAIEAEGIRRAAARAAAADLKLAVFDAAAESDPATLALVDEDTVVVANKCDRVPAPGKIAGHAPVAVSAATGAGLDRLLGILTDRAQTRLDAGNAPVLTRERHRRALEDARVALSRAQDATMPELAAEDLRLAARALGRITGRVDVEDILDVIFRDFCLGK